MERISAVLDANIQKLPAVRDATESKLSMGVPYRQCKQGDIEVSMINVVHNSNCCFARSGPMSSCVHKYHLGTHCRSLRIAFL